MSWIFLLAMGVGLSGPSSEQVADCIAATVGPEVITLTDIRIHRAFRLLPEPTGDLSPSPVRQTLEELVSQKVVLSLVRENIMISSEEIERLLSDLKANFDPQEWRNKLDAFGLEEDDLTPFLEQRLRYEKIIRLRFGQSVGVNLREIESYYNEIYVLQERSAGREPKPMAEVLDDLEPQVVKKKAEEQLAQWIKSLRGQADILVRPECLEQIR